MTNATTLQLENTANFGAILNQLIAKVDGLDRHYRHLAEQLNGSASAARSKSENQLIHGDCIEVMRTLPAASVDLILTDPPYLVRYKSRDGRTVLNDDHDGWLNPAYAEMHRVLKENSYCISFYPWHKVDRFMHAWKRAGFQAVGHFVFSKNYASSQSFTKAHHECAYLLAKGNPAKPTHPLRDVLGWKYTGNTLHPTQKPVEPLGELIKTYSVAGDLVLDPFAGSASVAMAAIAQGRRYLAIEKDASYYEIARKRLTGCQTSVLASMREQ